MNAKASTGLSNDELQAEKMISEGSPVSTVRKPRHRDEPKTGPKRPLFSSVEPSEGFFRSRIERISKKLGRRFVHELHEKRDRLPTSLANVPKQMHKVANQTSLVLELLDDFRTARYRAVPWHTIAVASAATLYTVSPADVVPDFLPVLGVLDDLTVIAIATRWIRKDLRLYCRFKGYPEHEYF